ncbi:hypothetical protein V6N12_031544 [Hibiscus sabdariffa]|uniref:Uncharacterized protein n=1 Tax=Hibiscus sabdariffa TaxID=183260 RepID=A0ABR2CPJ9_9ROSI
MGAAEETAFCKACARFGLRLYLYAVEANLGKWINMLLLLLTVEGFSLLETCFQGAYRDDNGNFREAERRIAGKLNMSLVLLLSVSPSPRHKP